MGKKNVLVRFRSAMGGFHKGDVTQYLVKLNEEHKASLEEMEEKVADLEQENDMLRQTVGTRRIEELEAQKQGLEENVRNLEEKVRLLEEQVAELSVTGDAEIREKELEAYRRAEAMERKASRRYRQVSGQVEDISGAMARELSGTVDSARNALDAIGTQLSVLQDVSEQLQATMQGGVEKLEAMANDCE